MSDYIENFKTVQFRTSLLYGPDYNPQLDIRDQGPHGIKLIQSVLSALNSNGFEKNTDIIGECYKTARVVSYALMELGIDHSIAIGNVSVDGVNQFATTAKSIEQDMNEGFEMDSAAVAHAWLTLASGQVLDCTILSSYFFHTKQIHLDIDEALYLSGHTKGLKLVHQPYVTGLAYHLYIVSTPGIQAHEKYAQWLTDLTVFKKNVKPATV